MIIIKRNLLVSPSTVVRVHRRRRQEHRHSHGTRRHVVRSIRVKRGRGRLMHRVHRAIRRMLPDHRSSPSSARSFPNGKSRRNEKKNTQTVFFCVCKKCFLCYIH